MSAAFDPYHQWLGIAPKDQPPTHYRLLGLDQFESDPDVIVAAADQKMGHIKSYHMGEHAEFAQKLLNEISAAKLCLLKPERKQAYDASLRQQLEQPRQKNIPQSALAQPTRPAVAKALPAAGAPARRVLKATPLPESPLPEAAAAPSPGGVANSPAKTVRKRRRNWLPLGAFATVCVVGFSVVGFLAHQRKAERAQQKQEAAAAQAAQGTAGSPAINGDGSAPQAPRTAEARPIVQQDGPSAPSPSRPTIVIESRQGAPTLVAGNVASPQPASNVPGTAAVPVQTPLPAGPKQPIPNQAAQQEATRVIQDIFKDDFAAPSQDPAELARKLLKHGSETRDDLAGRFVLLKLASKTAAEAGDCDVALRAVGAIGETFECDLLAMKTWVVVTAGAHAASRTQHTGLAKAGTALASESLKADAAESANQLAGLALRSARAIKDRELLEKAAIQALECEDVVEQLRAVQPALAALKTDPVNAAANATVGKYRCFFLANWPDGLPLLAKADDPALRAAAQHELAGPAKADERAQVADEWWALSDQEKGRSKRHLQTKAVAWYNMALAELQGLSKARAELRIRAAGDDHRAYDEVFLARAMERFGQDTVDKAESLLEEGIRLLASQKDKESLDKLQEAVKLNPESSEADFVIGTIYACVAKNPQLANRRFEACLKRDRTNGAILNNLAVTELKLGQTADAILHWKTALANSRQREIGHNIGRLVDEVAQKRISVVGSSFEALKKSYEGLRSTGEVPSRDPRKGWCLILPTKADSSVQPVLSMEVATLLSQTLSLRSGSDFLEDKSCSRCRGQGHVDCPVRNCSRGGVPTTQRVAIGQNPASGDIMYQDQKIRVPCQQCNGKGNVECPLCRGAGKDPAL